MKTLEARYKKLYDGSPEMYRTIDSNGIIIDCNQAYVDNLGYLTKNEVVGHSIFEHTAKESLDAMRQSFSEWQQTGHVRNKEVWLVKKDGTSFPVLVNASSLYDDARNLVGSNTVITDMTEIHNARQQMLDANRELKKAQELRDDFIRIAAHDLRSPIQPILGMAELALREPAHREKALHVILAEARRLKQLANDLLDVAKIESGIGLACDLRKVRASELVADIMNHAQLRVNNGGSDNHGRPYPKSVQVEAILSHNNNLMLQIDKDRMIQALTNIIDNSIKFTKVGRISIGTRILPDGKTFEIKILDTGTGIPEDILPRLFEKFASKGPTNSARGSDGQGTGLGLFISRSIVRAHGGDILAYNNSDGPGASFVVRIPIKTDNPKRLPPESP